MDEYLAKLYGTDQLVKEAEAPTSSDDAVVDAFAENLNVICKEAGIDPEQLSDADLTDAWNSYAETLNKEASEEGPVPGLSKQAFYEADKMGRVMAHAYVSELAGMEKEAGPKAKALWEATKAAPKTFGKGVKEVWQSGKKGKAALIGAPIAHAGAVTGGALGLRAALKKKKGKEKKGSYDDETIVKRAYELLAENGWVTTGGEVIPPEIGQYMMQKAAQEETPAEEKKEEEKKEEEEKKAMDEAALSYLAELGYPVTE